MVMIEKERMETREVPIATIGAIPTAATKAGTTNTPPPMPKKPARTPDAKPITTTRLLNILASPYATTGGDFVRNKVRWNMKIEI